MTKTAQRIATHVRFRSFTGERFIGVWVALEHAAEYFRAHQSERIDEVQFDGERRFWAFGKAWMYWDGADWNLARIGAGASGDLTIWRETDAAARGETR